MELSTKATEINAVTCNYGNLVSIYLHRFAVDSIQTLYLEHLVVLAVLESWLSWQLRTTLIILAFCLADIQLSRQFHKMVYLSILKRCNHGSRDICL